MMIYKIHILCCLVLSQFLIGQTYDSLAYLSRTKYIPFHLDSISMLEDKETKMLNSNYGIKNDGNYDAYMDRVFLIKGDENMYIVNDSIKPIKISKSALDTIHFWTMSDDRKLLRYFNLRKHQSDKLTFDQMFEAFKNYLNYHKNFFVIQRKEDEYFLYKVKSVPKPSY